MFGLAIAGLAIGIVAVGALTAPEAEPVAEETTSTTARAPTTNFDPETFTVDQIATGVPLEWQEGPDTFTGTPMQLVSHEDWLYLFTTDSDLGLAGVWRSSDGLEWEPLTHDLEADGRLVSISSTPRGLFALAAHRDGPGFDLWFSEDAVSWAPESSASLTNRLVSIHHFGVFGTDRITIVPSQAYGDAGYVVRDHLPALVGAAFDPTVQGWGWREIDEDDVLITIYGPLGLPAMAVRGSELGLSEDEMAILLDGNQERPAAFVWASLDGGPMVESTIEEASWIDSVATAPDGSLLAFGWTNVGHATWSSVDGTVWEKLDAGPLRPMRGLSWAEGLIGINALGSHELITSEDGIEWETVGLAGLFPTSLPWDIYTISTEDRTVVATLASWSHRDVSLDTPNPAVFTNGEATLTIDWHGGVIEMTVGEDSRIWTMHSSSVPDGTSMDLPAETVTFDLEGTTITVTFDEIEEAERIYWSATEGFNREIWALAITTDGEKWEVKDPSPVLGEGGRLISSALINGRLVALVTDDPFFYQPSAEPEFDIWAASLP